MFSDIDLVMLAAAEHANGARLRASQPSNVRVRVTFATRAAAPGLDRIMSPKHQAQPICGSPGALCVLPSRTGTERSPAPSAAVPAAASWPEEGEGDETPFGLQHAGALASGLLKIALLKA
jgi:hypothetical protein